MTKFRVSRWGNPFTGEVFYGIQVKTVGDTRYRHCCEGTKPLIYKTRSDANAKLREIRAAQEGKESFWPELPGSGGPDWTGHD